MAVGCKVGGKVADIVGLVDEWAVGCIVGAVEYSGSTALVGGALGIDIWSSLFSCRGSDVLRKCT